jgi:hypothetical protein
LVSFCVSRFFQPEPRGIERSFARIAAACLPMLSDAGHQAITLWTGKKREYARANHPSFMAAFIILTAGSHLLE